MEFQKLSIPDVILIKPKIISDSRGFFMETFREDFFKENDISYSFVQDNHSLSQAGILRGLHYQLRNPQGKIVRVATGKIFDVAVDLRKNSQTFGKWVSAILSNANRYALWIPPGFAHGFYTFEDNTNILYKCTDYYVINDEYTLLWNDSQIKIAWPTQNEKMLILSNKDKNGQSLKSAPVYE